MTRVGYDPFFPWAERTVLASLSKRDEQLVGRVEIVDADGVGQGAREISSPGPDCSALFETLALTIAIAIDPHALARSEPPPASPPSGPEAMSPQSPTVQTSLVEPPREAVPATSPTSSEPTTFRLAGAVRGDVGAEPGLAPGLAVSISFERPRFAVGLEVSSLLPTTTGVDVANLAGARVRGWVLRSTVLPCARFGHVSWCALASVGRFEGSAENAPDPRTRASAFVATGARVGVEFPLYEKLAMTLDAEVAANLYRTTLLVGTEPVWTAPPVSGGVGAGVATRF
ncbi:MAG: hypothetical protein KF819_04660 [Labilithrix sp.]|nr:hypothetical protein [Labilithrix sp.]